VNFCFILLIKETKKAVDKTSLLI